MKVLITGTSSGIGKACALLFLNQGHEVFGIDKEKSSIEDKKYTHFIADISKKELLPELNDVEILINNAGIQTGTEEDIQTNLFGTMYVTEKYAFQPSIKSVLFNSSVSSLTGNEFPTYVASKAGVTGYMKNCAIRLANEYRATCNALCFGGVLTELNKPVIENTKLWEKIMNVTPLKKWATPEEAAQWCYFMTVINTFCTGQAIDISGGERNCADLFVWED
jgi:3-oxoacyl-[acyl-carrier protein] reductase